MANEALLKSIVGNPNLPSPPSIALQVVDMASKPDCSMDKISQLVCMDPALSGKMLQTVNSAVFGLSRPATSIQRALAILGIKSVRSLVLSLSLPQMYRKVSSSVDMKTYWLLSVGTAIVARDLAKRMKCRDAEDDMAAGLLLDVGTMILQQSMPDAYKLVTARPAEELVHDRCIWEANLCGVDHAEVSAALLMEWRFPGEITQAVRAHHNPDAGSYTSDIAKSRAYLLHFASLAAQLLVTPDQPSVYEKMRELGQTRFSMNEAELAEFLAPLTSRIQEFARLMQVDIGKVEDFPAVLARATEELVILTVTANLDQHRAQEQRHQAESEAKRWREEAVFDPLTKVFNRRYFVTRLKEVLEPAAPTGQSAGILFLDLDGFKILNDKFGHRFGDQVLIEVAESLRREVRPGDVVARFGGDEFCILFESIDDAGCRAASNRVWQAINQLTITLDGQQGKVGASIGAIVCRPGEVRMSGEELLETADKAMYHSKKSGKNQVHFLSLERPAA